MRRSRQKDFSTGLSVTVEDGKIEKALRLFKKKIENAGLLKEVRERQHYVKPTTERKLKKNAAVKRWKKTLSAQKLPQRLY